MEQFDWGMQCHSSGNVGTKWCKPSNIYRSVDMATNKRANANSKISRPRTCVYITLFFRWTDFMKMHEHQEITGQ